MPIYKAVCRCGHAEDVFRPISQYDDMPHHCGEKMQRGVCAPAVIADIQPYRSMATGEFVGGRRQHRDHLKRHGLIEVGNEKLENKRPPPPPDLKADIASAVHKVLG